MSDETNAYIERQRALARERQQRSRDRRRNGHVTSRVVTDDNGRPSPRLARVAQHIIDGMTPSKALVTEGFPHNSYDMLDRKVVPVLSQECKALGLTRRTVLESTIESIRATSPMFTADGCIERPDWSARAAGRRDAIALLDRAGELPSASNTQHGPQITINIVRYSGGPQDVVGRHDDSIDITSESKEIAP
jgi:hypothetical protein